MTLPPDNIKEHRIGMRLQAFHVVSPFNAGASGDGFILLQGLPGFGAGVPHPTLHQDMNSHVVIDKILDAGFVDTIYKF